MQIGACRQANALLNDIELVKVQQEVRTALKTVCSVLSFARLRREEAVQFDLVAKTSQSVRLHGYRISYSHVMTTFRDIKEQVGRSNELIC